MCYLNRFSFISIHITNLLQLWREQKEFYSSHFKNIKVIKISIRDSDGMQAHIRQ